MAAVELNAAEMLVTVEDEAARLYVASHDGNLEEVRRILVDDSVDIDHIDFPIFGRTPLATAARNGHLAVVQELLNGGADPNKGKLNGWTALHSAATFGHLDVVQELLHRGADPNKQTEYGETALHRAAKKGHIQVFQALVDGGGDPNIVDDNGKTAAQLAHELMLSVPVQPVELLTDPEDRHAYRINRWTPYYVGAAVAGALVGIISNWLIRYVNP